jgi:hypothetical protein
MMGLGARGRVGRVNPWIFREIKHKLASGENLPRPILAEKIPIKSTESKPQAFSGTANFNRKIPIIRRHAKFLEKILAKPTALFRPATPQPINQTSTTTFLF